MIRIISRFVILVAVISFAPSVWSAEQQFRITVSAGQRDHHPAPASVTLSVPRELASVTLATLRATHAKETTLVGQLAAPALLETRVGDTDAAAAKSPTVPRVLHWIAPALRAGESVEYVATVSSEPPKSRDGYHWRTTPGQHIELQAGDRPVLRYMHAAIDKTSKASRDLTYKVYHHLFSPDGSKLVTKGPGGLFPHHRGLFYGFNRISYAGGKKQADVWHCTGDAHQSHQAVVSSEAGPVLGRHRLKIHWHGPGEEVFAEELRELTVYDAGKGQLVEFASRLTTKVGPIKLDGDPQHAGFQFRASNDVADKTKAKTYYLRPDGVGKPGETRNWDAKSRDAKCVNLPWKGMCFALGDGTVYTAAYLDHPANPKEARASERDYGRFGTYFEYQLTEDKPLEVRYRLWLQDGEMKASDLEALSANFITPPVVILAKKR